MEMLDALLVIDDDRDVLQAAEFVLAGHVRSIVTADTPDAARDLIGATRFDCVLLDMNFGAGDRSGRDGMAILAEIRAVDPTLAVILTTAYGAVSLAVESLKRGAQDFLLKPWRNDALVTAVRGAAAQSKAARTPRTLDAIERSAIAEALDRHGGNIARAATALGLSRPGLYRRMAKYGL